MVPNILINKSLKILKLTMPLFIWQQSRSHEVHSEVDFGFKKCMNFTPLPPSIILWEVAL